MNDFDLDAHAESEVRRELVRLRAFHRAFDAAVPLLETHASRTSDAFPKTSQALRELIDAFRVSQAVG